MNLMQGSKQASAVKRAGWPAGELRPLSASERRQSGLARGNSSDMMDLEGWAGFEYGRHCATELSKKTSQETEVKICLIFSDNCENCLRWEMPEGE